jgi:hypothetical protein
VVLRKTGHQLLLHRVIDALLDACIELEGASDGTFEAAIKAQIDNGGWSPFFFESSEKSEARLAKVAHLFPHRSDEFIAKSAKTAEKTGSLFYAWRCRRFERQSSYGSFEQSESYGVLPWAWGQTEQK